LNIDIASTTASLQGFGNVARYAALLYADMGGRVVSISNRSYTFRKKDGIDVKKMASIRETFGTIDRQKAEELGCEVLEGGEWIAQDVDILLPCALENQLTSETFSKVSDRVKVICEGANGPTTPDCDELIKSRNIFLIPDVLCNAGGVTCSYFEQIQSNTNYYWSREKVLEMLDEKMTAAFKAVYELAKEKGLYMRDAAYVIAINRVAEAVKLRGWV
jgi:glutamate dehydrogenase (NAD(P)+)